MVSLMIPVYNREDYIERAVTSAMSQTHRECEVVVVDNASTDGTWQVLLSLRERYPRLRVFRNEANVGPFQNWKECLVKARGEYGTFLWSDDWYEPTFVAAHLPALSDDDVGFSYSSVVIHEADRQWVMYRVSRHDRRIPREEFFNGVMKYGRYPFSPCCALFRILDLREALLVRSSILDGIRYRDNGAGPDLLMFLVALEARGKCCFRSVPLVHYLSHPQSISNRRDYSHQYRLTVMRYFNQQGYSRALARILRMYRRPARTQTW